ncbi:MAG: adenylosuccinate synthetase [Thermoplasmata archaeon]|nr:adenylosuccinate synthetase [Euryarchaeota archaeon]RLF65808.1 MAG: adenylosuccinate synthetase [Thermoplasmata archaeon]
MITVIVGGFFGDEGKGKVAAYIGIKENYTLAIRTGAINAGHTVFYNGREYKFRALPCASLKKDVEVLIAPGALIRLDVFFKEIEMIGRHSGIYVDKNTGIITEEHVRREEADENLTKRIGSTKQGVGAAMADRVLRRLKLASEYEELKEFIVDGLEIIEKHMSSGKILIEGTQGTFLSLYHGTYPYVTSRDVTASGILSEAGIGPKYVDEIVLVFKAFVTRVGAGPLEGELPPKEAKRMGIVEYGTVTGRPRRVAPFNFNYARRAIKLNSPTVLAITKIDALYKEAYGVKRWEDLPKEAREFIENIEDELKVPVKYIGTGPEMDHMVVREL